MPMGNIISPLERGDLRRTFAGVFSRSYCTQMRAALSALFRFVLGLFVGGAVKIGLSHNFRDFGMVEIFA